MVASASDGHVLLVKKLGGLFSVIIGCLLTAVGVTFDPPVQLLSVFYFLRLVPSCSRLRS
jgi:hypothetical protein